MGSRVWLFICTGMACLMATGAIAPYAVGSAAAEEYESGSSDLLEPTEPEVTPRDTWCLDGDNSGHVAAAADSFGSAVRDNQTVVVDQGHLTIKEWSEQAPADFETACERAFSLYGPNADGGGDSTDTLEMLLPVVTALVGGALGAAAAHGSAAARDRKLWIREDTAILRRLSVETRSATEVAVSADLQSAAGAPSAERLKLVACELGAILADKTLDGDANATTAREKVDSVVSGLEKTPGAVEKDAGLEAARLARENAASWATKLHPKPTKRN